MWDAAQAGDIDRAREIDAELTPVYEGLSVTTNPIPIKAALEMLGLASDRMRLPLVPADAEQRAAVQVRAGGPRPSARRRLHQLLKRVSD